MCSNRTNLISALMSRTQGKWPGLRIVSVIIRLARSLKMLATSNSGGCAVMHESEIRIHFVCERPIMGASMLIVQGENQHLLKSPISVPLQAMSGKSDNARRECRRDSKMDAKSASQVVSSIYRRFQIYKRLGLFEFQFQSLSHEVHILSRTSFGI